MYRIKEVASKRLSKWCPLIIVLLLVQQAIVVFCDYGDYGGGGDEPAMAMGEEGRGIHLPDDEKKKLEAEGFCIDDGDEGNFTKMCAIEVDRGGMIVPKKEEGFKHLVTICIKFSGFQVEGKEEPDCSKTSCFNMTHSVTFWLVAVGIPLSIIIALITLFWLCTHLAYYMLCCCIFHMKVPKAMDRGHHHGPATNQVAPASSTTTSATPRKSVTSATPRKSVTTAKSSEQGTPKPKEKDIEKNEPEKREPEKKEPEKKEPEKKEPAKVEEKRESAPAAEEKKEPAVVTETKEVAPSQKSKKKKPAAKK